MENKGKKSKGDSFERQIAKEIGLWWEGDGTAFWRTSGSGARARRVDIHPGDIGPIKNLSRRFPFCVECRAREVWDLDRILWAPKPEPLVWFAENSRVAGDQYLSLLIAKKNFRTPVAVFPSWGISGGLLSDHSVRGPMLYVALNSIRILSVVPLSTFFNTYKPSLFNDTSPQSQLFLDLKQQERRAVSCIERYLETA